MIPAIHSIRLAARPSRTALMIGTPPATAASNPTITPCFCAAAKISLPCTASIALLAVTRCLPFAIALRVSSFAIVYPPISSITMSMSGLATTSLPSATHRACPPVRRCARSRSLSATIAMRISRPARRWISSRLRASTVQVPPPTVPMPSRPTLIGFIESAEEARGGQRKTRTALRPRAWS